MSGRGSRPAQACSVSARKLSGELVWGPALVELTGRQLRQRVAADLEVPLYRLRLVKGSQLVDGETQLETEGGQELELQLILEDPSEVIRKVQGFLRCEVQPGLKEEERRRAEDRYKVVFPPDVKEFLEVGLPVGNGWHNWRQLAMEEVESREDTVFQIRKLHCTPWRVRYNKDRQWDEEETLEKAQDFATNRYPLIPLCQHRCIPSVPHDAGLPILSMHGCYDNLCHSRNFWSWLEEMHDIPAGIIPQEWKDHQVPIWDVPFWQHWYDI